MTSPTVGSSAALTSGVTLLIGGARSGKSDLAVQIGERHQLSRGGEVTFIATAQPSDDDMTQRISRHRSDRPTWPTIEEPFDLSRALAIVPPDDLAIVDCLTLWVSNSMLLELSDDEICDRSAQASWVAAARSAPTVVVTNEVGLGVHPPHELGRRYRDLLGLVNRQWAAVARRSLFLVSGRALQLHDPWELLT